MYFKNIIPLDKGLAFIVRSIIGTVQMESVLFIIDICVIY